MIEYLTFSTTGLILKTGTCQLDMLALQASGTDTALQGTANDSLQYIPDVNTPVITDKLANTSSIDKTTIIANGIDTSIISSIPVSSVAAFTVPASAADIPDMAITDGVVSFTATNPGDYIITLELFPYLKYEVTVTAS